MALNVGQMLAECSEALGEISDARKAPDFIEKWVPEVANEIEELRNRVLFQDIRITELEGELEQWNS